MIQIGEDVCKKIGAKGRVDGILVMVAGGGGEGMKVSALSAIIKFKYM